MRIAVMALLFTLAAHAASAQKPAPPPEKPPVFSSRSELVLIPVVVRNHNQFVSGLKPEQFTVLDDGKPRRLSIFEEGTAAKRTEPEPKPLGPHEFSNNARQAPERPLTIILLDLLNTSFKDRDFARQAIVKFLGENIDADQPTALLILDSRGIKEVHSFTWDISSFHLNIPRSSHTRTAC